MLPLPPPVSQSSLTRARKTCEPPPPQRKASPFVLRIVFLGWLSLSIGVLTTMAVWVAPIEEHSQPFLSDPRILISEKVAYIFGGNTFGILALILGAIAFFKSRRSAGRLLMLLAVITVVFGIVGAYRREPTNGKMAIEQWKCPAHRDTGRPRPPHNSSHPSSLARLRLHNREPRPHVTYSPHDRNTQIAAS